MLLVTWRKSRSASPSSGAFAGAVREGCLSGEPSRYLLRQPHHEPRVPERPAWASSAGNPVGAALPGRLFFGYFLFGEAKESNLPSGNPRHHLGKVRNFFQSATFLPLWSIKENKLLHGFQLFSFLIGTGIRYTLFQSPYNAHNLCANGIGANLS